MVGSPINGTGLRNMGYLFRLFVHSVFHAENGQSIGQFQRFSGTQESTVR